MKTPGQIFAQPKMILRLGGGICFIAHGLLALTAKPGFVGLLGSFGLELAPGHDISYTTFFNQSADNYAALQEGYQEERDDEDDHHFGNAWHSDREYSVADSLHPSCPIP